MNKTHKNLLFAALVMLGLAVVVSAHPHFRKTVIATLPDLEVKLAYTTLPWNPAHLAEVKEGFVFHCGGATVEFNKPVKIGAQELAAGKYLLRARAKDVNNWTFILLPAPPDRNTQPDMTKAIELATKTLTGQPIQQHLSLDITPGHGDTDGKALFVLNWGDRQLEGVLASFALPKQ